MVWLNFRTLALCFLRTAHDLKRFPLSRLLWPPHHLLGNSVATLRGCWEPILCVCGTRNAVLCHN